MSELLLKYDCALDDAIALEVLALRGVAAGNLAFVVRDKGTGEANDEVWLTRQQSVAMARAVLAHYGEAAL